jgi:hypothetical protein
MEKEVKVMAMKGVEESLSDQISNKKKLKKKLKIKKLKRIFLKTNLSTRAKEIAVVRGIASLNNISLL